MLTRKLNREESFQKQPNNLGKFQHVPSLDGVRGIAIFGVLLIHTTYGIIQGGFIGVDLFFVLSGYLITSLLQNEFFTNGKISFSKFYIRRALRLFPPLLICVAATYILWPYIHHETLEENRVTSVVATLFYFSNIIRKSMLGPLVHVWSLSVEEHFYLFWPFFVTAFLFLISFRKRIITLFFVIFSVGVFRVWVFYYALQNGKELTYGVLAIDSYTFTFCRIDAILMGALFSIVSVKHSFLNQFTINKGYFLFVLLFLLAAIFAFLNLNNVVWRYGGFVLTNLLCLAIVIFAVKDPNNNLLTNPVLQWLGKRSYGIYVYHYLIFNLLEVLRKLHSKVNFMLVTILFLGLSFVIAELSFRFIEAPILKYKKKFQVKAEVLPQKR